VTGAAPLVLPESLPPEWLQFVADGTVARWVETGYDAERSPARAREIFGAVKTKATALTLRQVFLTLTKASRASDAKVGGQ